MLNVTEEDDHDIINDKDWTPSVVCIVWLSVTYWHMSERTGYFKVGELFSQQRWFNRILTLYSAQ